MIKNLLLNSVNAKNIFTIVNWLVLTHLNILQQSQSKMKKYVELFKAKGISVSDKTALLPFLKINILRKETDGWSLCMILSTMLAHKLNSGTSTPDQLTLYQLDFTLFCESHRVTQVQAGPILNQVTGCPKGLFTIIIYLFYFCLCFLSFYNIIYISI